MRNDTHFEKVTHLLYANGYKRKLEREDMAVVGYIGKASGRLAISLADSFTSGTPDADLMKYAKEWYEISCRMYHFWAELGCPRLPEPEPIVYEGEPEKVNKADYPDYSRVPS